MAVQHLQHVCAVTGSLGLTWAHFKSLMRRHHGGTIYKPMFVAGGRKNVQQLCSQSAQPLLPGMCVMQVADGRPLQH